MQRQPYPSDVTDEEWAFVAPYLTLMTEAALQRRHDRREVFTGVRYIVKTGGQWRSLPHDLPPWAAVYQQARRWLAAGCFHAILHDLRAILRLAAGRPAQPTAAIFDGQTLQSTPESGRRAGWDGHKRRKGSKVHLAVDTLGHLLALHVSAANEQERAHVGRLAQAVREATGQHVELAYVDEGYSGPNAAEAAAAQGIRLEVVKSPSAFATHSVVRRFIEHFAPFHDLAHIEVAEGQPLGHLFGGARQQVQRKARVGAGDDLDRLVHRLLVEWQNDEQVDVGVGSRDARGVRAEEYDAVGMELLDDAVAERLNLAVTDRCEPPLSATLVA